jgi:hypothetical protein
MPITIPEPTCTLKVDRPHHSTSIKEKHNIDAIKLNITSECTADQKYSRINARIEKLENNREVTIRNFTPRIAEPTSKSPRKVFFRNLFAECKLGVGTAYKGVAEGYVILKNGKKVNVTASSGKYEVVNCAIGAQ